MYKGQKKANKNIYTRRDLLKTLGLAATGSCAPGISGCGVFKATSSSESGNRCRTDKPNILFITTDYQRGVDGPSLGSPFLKMPALARLCREGAVFVRHYSTSPICMPARYTWITGQYPHTHGQWDNHKRWVPDGSPVLMQLLKEQGYQTVAVGKMHFHPWDRMAGYDRRIIHEGKHNMVPDDYEEFLNAHGHSRKEFLENYGGAMAVCKWPWDESLHHDVFVGTQARGVIGKWHLSGYAYHGSKNEVRAIHHGFDEELVTEIKGVGNGANFYPYVFRTQEISWRNVKEQRLPGKEYLVDRMNMEAVDFIERYKIKPFFLYLSHFATHTILNGKEELVEKYRKKHPPGKSNRSRCYLCQDAGFEGDALNHWAQDYNPHLAAMLESIDDGVGMIMNKLDELGLADNSILIFTSDNGGETNVTSNAPLREGKSCLYEGGIREPLIVCWPGVVPANTVCNWPVSILDFYPTFLQAANIKPDRQQKLDGTSILPVLKNPTANLKRNALYWHYPLEKPHFLGGHSSGAIRAGDWKLIEFFEDGRAELYNLKNDIGEKHNLARQYPQKVAELQKRLADWRREVGAKLTAEPWVAGADKTATM